MARNNGKSDNTNTNPFKGFINISIPDADKHNIEASWAKAKYAEIFTDLVDVGKLSVSFNPKNQTYNAAIVFYGGDVGGWCVSSFAPNPLMAVYLTWFKLHNYPELVVPDAADTNRPTYG